MAKRKSYIGAVALLLVAGFVFAAGEIENWSNTQNGTVRINRTSAGANSIEADAFVGDLTGDVTGNVTGNVTSSGQSTKTPTSASVTNGQAYTVASDVVILTGIGQANDFTNSITLANPTAVGNEVTILVAGTSTNLIGLADSGNLKLTAAFVGDNYDTITLYAQEAAVWTETSRTDN